MHRYIFAILGLLLLILIVAAILGSINYRKSKSPREDIKRGRTFAEPLEEEPNVSQTKGDDLQTPSSSKPPEERNKS